MPNLSVNPDLPLSWRRAGTFVYINANAGSAGLPDIERRLLIVAERLPGGAKVANTTYRVNSVDDVNAGSGQGSTASRMYSAAISTPGVAGAVEVWICGVDPGSGTVASYPIKIFGPATAPGSLTVWVCGYPASVSFATGDSGDTIATALVVELNKLLDAPFLTTGTPWTDASGIITGTYSIIGAIGEDVPFRFACTPNAGVGVGVSLLFASSVSGAGSVKITCGQQSISIPIADSDTATAVAGKVYAGIRAANDFPLQCPNVNTAGALDVYFASDPSLPMDVRRVTAKVLTSTGTTIAVNGGSGIAAGTVAPVGVLGTGVPTLTTALSNLAKREGFAEWALAWTDTGALSAVAASLDSEGGGLVQKGQRATYCSTDSLANAGAIPPATTPALTSASGLRWHPLWLPDAAQQGCEYSARVAAVRAAQVADYAPKNWAGFRLATSGSVPLLGTSYRPSGADINAAIESYCMTPLDSDPATGLTKIEMGRSAVSSNDRGLQHWSTIDQLDWQRSRIIERAADRFTNPDGSGMTLKKTGTPFTPNCIDEDSYVDMIYELMDEWYRADKFEDPSALRNGIKATPNTTDGARTDAQYPASVLLPAIQFSVVENRTPA